MVNEKGMGEDGKVEDLHHGAAFEDGEGGKPRWGIVCWDLWSKMGKGEGK